MPITTETFQKYFGWRPCWGGWEQTFNASEGEIVSSYRSADRDLQLKILAAADAWCRDHPSNESYLINDRAKKYTHHMAAGLAEVLAYKCFSHVSIDDLHCYHFERHYWREAGEYKHGYACEPHFYSLDSIAEQIAEHFGLFCRIDECVHHCSGKNDLRGHDYWGTICEHWIQGLCFHCWEALDHPWRENKLDEIVDKERESRKNNVRPYPEDLIDELHKICVYITCLGPKAAADNLGIPVKQARAFTKAMRKFRADFVVPVKKTHRKWKAAYDAVTELGVSI